MGKFLKVVKVVLNYSWVLEYIFELLKTAESLTKNKFEIKELVSKLKQVFGEIELSPTTINDFKVSAELVKEAGGIGKLREFLEEAKQAGVLQQIDDLISDDSPLLTKV